MSTTFYTLTLAVLLPAAPPAQTETPRKPNPFAPSLPQLTEEEEDDLDRVIDRFILFDTGRLRGEEGRKALVDFHKLGPEALPALIRGMNRAAHIEASCPAVTIGKKLAALLNASNDLDLLEFARENIGAGVEQSRHMGVIRDLRVMCMFRKRTVTQAGIAFKPPPRTATVALVELRSMTISELLRGSSERPPSRELVIKELDRRPREQVMSELGSVAADSSNKKGQSLARDLLGNYLSRLTPKLLREQLRDDAPEVRAAASKVIAAKGLRYWDDLVELLTDSNEVVVQASRQALVRLSRGQDFGPQPEASESDRSRAAERWRDWWTRQAGR